MLVNLLLTPAFIAYNYTRLCYVHLIGFKNVV